MRKIIFFILIFIIADLDIKVNDNFDVSLVFCNTAQASYATVRDRVCGSSKRIRCSAPIKNPYDAKFQGACSTHDYCYRFGYATYGESQVFCDAAFLHEMNNICSNLDWMLLASSGLSFAACRTAAKVYYSAVLVAGASSFQKGRKKCQYKGLCPPGKFSTTGNLNNCKCPLNTRKVYTEKITKSTAYCKGLVDCPTGIFYTDGEYRGCRCHAGVGKSYSGLGNIQAQCKGAAGIATCPKGKFSTTGKFRNCKCAGGTSKKRWGAGNMYGMCAGEENKRTCPKGKFSTTGKFRNCKCPGGQGKKRWGVGSMYGMCKGTAGKARCPGGKFKTTKKWRGCKCPAGKKKKYTNIFKSKAQCR